MFGVTVAIDHGCADAAQQHQAQTAGDGLLVQFERRREAGRIEGFTPDGERAAVQWNEVAADPGWCKLDWVIADPQRGQLANASNMLDVTWEAPDGTITPLDGYLDGFFQEVYLEADSIPIFSKLVKNVSGNALDDYVGQLQKEVKKYVFYRFGSHHFFGSFSTKISR